MWLLFSLIAPLFWAVSGYIDKYSIENKTLSTPDYLFFSCFSSLVFIPLLLIFFGAPEVSVFALLAVLSGCVLVLSFVFYAEALKVAETSYILMLSPTISVFTLIGGAVFLGQFPTLNDLGAALIVLIGAFLLVYQKIDGRHGIKRGTKWMMISLFIWSGMFLMNDWTLNYIDYGSFMVWESFGVCLFGASLFIIPAIRSQVLLGIKSAPKAKYGWFLFNNVFDLLGQLSIKMAIMIAPIVGLVTVVTQIQTVYAVVIGIILTLLLPKYFKEDLSKKEIAKKLLASTVMIIGVALLAV